MSDRKVYDYWQARARSRDPADFWGQVGKTVHGKTVDEEQVAMVVDAVSTGLALTNDDILLDLCCGNGALSARLFDRCAGGTGVDFSDYLIGVAWRHFERPPERIFVLEDVLEFGHTSTDTSRFTKAVCYGSFAYMAPEIAREVLAILRHRFSGLRCAFIGNVPDKALMNAFFDPDAYTPGIEDDHTSPIGRWWTTEEVAKLATATGWSAEFRRMPELYFTAHYRFDAILVPE